MAPSNGQNSRSFDSWPTITSQYSHMYRVPGGMLTSNYPVDPATQGTSREPKPGPEDNIPPRFESFTLLPGEKKVTEEADTRVQSTSIFTFNKEDHTLGNMLASRLLEMRTVLYAGYKVPHPLVSQFELRVQTDGTITPRAALIQSCRDLVTSLSHFSREFTKEWELRKMVGAGAEETNGDK